jgi:hypothetical protein
MDENYLKLGILKLQTTQPVLEVVKTFKMATKTKHNYFYRVSRDV